MTDLDTIPVPMDNGELARAGVRLLSDLSGDHYWDVYWLIGRRKESTGLRFDRAMPALTASAALNERAER